VSTYRVILSRLAPVRHSTGPRRVALLLLAALAAGCAPFHPESAPSPAGGGVPDVATRVVGTAMTQVGVPYRYGGSSPAQGFDCSGLVFYAYGQQGIAVPRTAAQQFAAAIPVREQDLRPGDLVFFRLAGPRDDVSHVGIYSGQRRFVHAPQSGRRVGEASLDDEFYRQRLAGYGRFLAPAYSSLGTAH
jgi:cell wall-associated NlpC family hydrolase